MDKEKVTKKINKKYGVEPSVIRDSSTSKIKDLKLRKKINRIENDKFKFVKKPIGVLVKGGSMGAGLAGTVNTLFPNIVPVIGAALTESSNMSPLEKALGFTVMASKPVDIISGPTIIGVGALAGAILYGGYRLVKVGVDNISIVVDRKNAKKMSLTK